MARYSVLSAKKISPEFQQPHGVEIQVDFELVSELMNVETFASGRRIRNLRRLNRQYGFARWRKRKGIALIRFSNGRECLAELHWYEASGIGRKEMKVKWLLG